MSEKKQKQRSPQKKTKKAKVMKIIYFLMGVAVTLFLIGVYNLIIEVQEDTKPITNDSCKVSKPKINISKMITPTPEIIRTTNISDKDLEVNAEINI